MKISMGQITTLTKDMETDFATYAKAGIRFVEMAFPKMYKYLKTHSVEELKAAFEAAGLTPISAIGMAPEKAAILAAHTAEELTDYFGMLEEQLQLCSQLGCKLINLGTDADDKLYPGWEVQAEKNIARAGKMAAKYNMRVAVEDGGVFRTIALVDKVNMDNVGWCIDYFWYFKHGHTIEQFKELKFDKLFNIHLCDLPEGFDVESMDDSIRVLPGDGCLPLLDWTKQMIAAGFDGLCTLELLNEEIWNMDAQEACIKCMKAMEPYANL